MKRYTHYIYIGVSIILALVIVGCKVSFSLNGASIDYTKVKTIHIS